MCAKNRVIVCFGPGPRFKGGIQNYNTSLALALDKLENTDVHIVSWTQQYPAIVPREFVDKSSKTDLLEGSGIKIKYITNYNSPSTWKETSNYIISLHPEKVIFQWSIALQGLPIGYIVKQLRKHRGIEVLLDLHFVVQKENSSLDRYFTKRGIGRASAYIVHALKTAEELQQLFPSRRFIIDETGKRSVDAAETTVIKLFHPIYDLFKPDPGFDKNLFKQQNALKENVFLFFGFIRKYKGLHNTIRAFRKVCDQRSDVTLLICGESFWQTLDNKKWSSRVKNFLFSTAKRIFLRKSDDERDYRPLDLIAELGIEKQCVVFNSFIPNEDVHKYFQSSDCVILYYLTATPSGIESLSYNFGLPILATAVGHFPETIRDGFNGYLAKQCDIDDMAAQMLRFLEHPLPTENIKEATRNMSWDNYAKAILQG
ncbi:MAG: glycosyltransferase family 4 protein [Crocinitomicaceae bacterium]|nr:glycosyltransferase family 4 protein [Crocinitomicaceae bacterium]